MTKTLAELENQDIRWVKLRGWRQHFELRDAAGGVLGHIRRVRNRNNRFEVDAVGNRWQFERRTERVGFLRWQQVIHIRSINTGDQPAVFRYIRRKRVSGELVYPDGRVYLWQRANNWGSKWAWTTEAGDPLLGFQTGGSFRAGAGISLKADMEPSKAPTILVFLGWYLLTLYQQDQMAAAMVIAAGT